MKNINIALAVLCCILLSAPAYAGSHTGIEIIDLRIGAAPWITKVTAGYVLIRNNGSEDDRLIGVSAGFAGKSELHSMEVTDGVMKMRPLTDGIIIPAGEEVTLEPGGLHLMFTKLTDKPKKGEMRDVTFVFEKAGAMTFPAFVKKIRHGQ